MDEIQKRREETQHPLTRHKPARTNSVGGKAVAHTVAPSTFLPLPPPPKTSQPPVSLPADAVRRLAAAEAARLLGSAETWAERQERERWERAKKESEIRKESGLLKQAANNARMALLKAARVPPPPPKKPPQKLSQWGMLSILLGRECEENGVSELTRQQRDAERLFHAERKAGEKAARAKAAGA